MPKNFQSFLKGNVAETANVSVKIARFPEEIVLRPLLSEEAEAIQDRSFKNVSGKKGKQERTFDVVRYNRDVCAASFVFPDLNDKELQNSYGVLGAGNLFSKMFYVGESSQILEKVTEISEIDKSTDDEIEEAKN